MTTEEQKAKNREKSKLWRETHPGYETEHRSEESKKKHREYMRGWYERNPGRNSQNVRNWRKKNPERYRELVNQSCKRLRKADPSKYKAKDRRIDLKRKYGVTVEWYEKQLALQGGGCAICGSSEKIAGRNLPVDHCHATKKTRGILCQHCNISLHRLESTPGWIEEAADYLKSF